MRRCCVRWQVAAARNNSFERIAATSIKERLKSAPQRSPVSSEERKNESLTACKDHLVGAGLQMASAARRRSVDDVELSIEDSAVQFRAIARRRDRGYRFVFTLGRPKAGAQNLGGFNGRRLTVSAAAARLRPS